MPTQQGVLKMNRYNTARKTRRFAVAGLTLVESLISLATTSVALGYAVPGFEAARERRALEAHAAQLETDIQLARSEAVTHNRTVRISFGNNEAGSCYVVHTGASGSCTCNATGAPACQSGEHPMRSTGFASGSSVQLRSNVPSIVFDPFKGTSSPTGTMRFNSAAHELRLVVNIMGRVRSCTPNRTLSGYPAC